MSVTIVFADNAKRKNLQTLEACRDIPYLILWMD
jgi:hypothetical protein